MKLGSDGCVAAFHLWFVGLVVYLRNLDSHHVLLLRRRISEAKGENLFCSGMADHLSPEGQISLSSLRWVWERGFE